MSVLWTLAGLLYTFLLPLATANTEIRNFDASQERVVAPFPSAITSRFNVLNSTHRENTFQIAPAALGTPLSSVCKDLGDGADCLNEIWLKLDLEDPAWINYAKFTIRISWPAFVSPISNNDPSTWFLIPYISYSTLQTLILLCSHQQSLQNTSTSYRTLAKK